MKKIRLNMQMESNPKPPELGELQEKTTARLRVELTREKERDDVG